MNFQFFGPNVITDASTPTLDVYEDEPLSINTDYHASEPSLGALIDKDPDAVFSWSAGAGTSTVLHVSLASATDINTLLLQNINFSNFAIQINSAAVTPIGMGTTTAAWDDWTDTGLYLEFATTSAQTIDIIVYTTTSGGDRQCGQVIAIEKQYELPWNPNFADYRPILSGRRQEKVMSDGGVKTYSISEKFRGTIRLNYVPPSVTSALYSMYNTTSSFTFVPYPTVTAWDQDAWDINFVGNFDLKQPANNDTDNPYYKGTITIAETAQ